VSSILLWSYHRTERALAFTASGQRDFQVQYQVGGTRQVAARNDLFATTSSARVAIYGNKTWWTASGHTTWSSASTCPGESGWDWAAAIRQGIACSAYKVAGRQDINGTRTIKLVHYVARSLYQTLWVSAATYLPVRFEETSRFTIDYRWLRPTAGNLAQLTMPVPAGFTKVAAP
jgi:hypothetical protein